MAGNGVSGARPISSKLTSVDRRQAGLQHVTHAPATPRDWRSAIVGGAMVTAEGSVAASVATLDILKDGKIQTKLNEASADLEQKFARLAEEEHVEARLQALGGQFQVYFTDQEVKDYRTAAKADSKRFMIFQGEMLRQGIYLLPIALFHHGLVAAHSEDDIEKILAAMRASLQTVRQRFGS